MSSSSPAMPKPESLSRKAGQLRGAQARVAEFRKLRERVGALAARIAPAGSPEAEELAALIAELSVHQVELEVQTEQLEQSKAALDRALRLYFQHFDASPMAVFRFDAAGGIREANHHGQSILGLSREQLAAEPGKATLLYALPPEERSMWRAFLDRVVVHGGPAHTEVILQTEPGCQRRYEVCGVRVESATQSDVHRVVAYFNDVTERRAAESDLRRLAEVLRKFSTQVPGVLFQLRRWPEGRFAVPYVGETVERYFGVTPEELETRPTSIAAAVHPEDIRLVRHALMWSQDTLDAWRQEFRVQTPQIGLRWVLAQAVPELLEDGSTLWHGFLSDVTEQRRVAEERASLEVRLRQVQKLESLGVMAGGVAHDFNNLLTAMLGNASLAQLELPPDAPAYRYLGEIEHAARRAAELTRQMLAYAGRAKARLETVDLNRIVREMRSIAEVSLSKKVRLRPLLDGNLPFLEADPTQLRQVVLNLLLNASDAIGDQDGEIVVKTGVEALSRTQLDRMLLGNEQTPGRFVVLEVSDTGCGMDAETQARIFDPFFTTKFTGRGLGLSAVLGIVRGHHAAIGLQSEKGVGTTFRIVLSIPDAPCDAASAENVVPPPVAGGASGLILLVDDEPPVRALGRRALHYLGYSVVEAQHGREALERFRENPSAYAAAIIDLRMPEMDGAETLEALRQIRADLPALLASGYGETELEQRFAGVERAALLAKPFDVATLASKLALVRGEPA